MTERKTIPIGTPIGSVVVEERRGLSGTNSTYMVRCACGRLDQMKSTRLRRGGDTLACRVCVAKRSGALVKLRMLEAKLGGTDE